MNRQRKTISKTRRLVPKGSGPRGFLARRWPVLLVAAVLVSAGVVLWAFQPYWKVLGQFSSEARVLPSRIYESPPRLARGQRVGIRDLVAMLEARGYRLAGAEDELAVGTYRQAGDRVRVHLRSFPTAQGWTVPLELSFRFRRARLVEVQLLQDGVGAGEPQAVEAAWLDPRLIRSILSRDGGDRWPLRVDDLPQHVVQAVLAAEDARFFDHRGVSVRGIVRAFVSNARGSGNLQGGSTLTQQLVKNLYLSPERKISRKVREAILAVYLELRYEKEEILEAYLNEIYLGRRGGANLMGVGAASRVFFGLPPEELSLAQAATVAGMIQSPANLAPDLHAEEARVRRDWVLDRMVTVGFIEAAAGEAAKEEELQTFTGGRETSGARYAVDAIVAELTQRYGLDDLADGGFVVVSTLDEQDQVAAEAAVRDQLTALDERVRKADALLQGALVAADPRNGAVRAWVGGREYGESQFDRVRQARRQVGSAFKPVVLAAAFSERTTRPSDVLMDEPLTLVLNGRSWSPSNADDTFRGEVTVRETVEESLNIPAIRLALDVGLERVVAWGRRMGIESPLRPLPSLALGAFEMTPLELLGVYSTLANGGSRPPLHLVEGVLNRTGMPVAGAALAPAERVLEEGVAFLTTSVLEGVVERGTGRNLRAYELRGSVAAKSGTTNERRDAWFAGYTPSMVAVAWVGYDEPATTGLSGTSGALPIFGGFMRAIQPEGGFGIFRQPSSVTTRTIDPFTGELATERCTSYIVETYLQDDAPTELCPMHDGRGDRRGFWRRMLGRRSSSG